MRDLLRRRLGTVAILVVVLLFLFSNRIATFLTELWWFDAVGARRVFTTILSAQVLLGAVFGVFLAALVAGNLIYAWRKRPFFVPTTPQQAIVERYRQMVDPYVPWVIAALALLFGATSGAAVASQWEPFLLWRNAKEFGVADPQFGRDIGFYVFSLPWWSFVQTWLFTSVLLVTLLTVGAHYLLGGVRPESRTDKLLPNVKAHLSVLLAVLLAIRAWGYWLDRYMLNYSPRGTVTGASFTDVNAELPALYLLLGISAIAILMVLVSIRRRGFLLPGAAIALLVLASILLQGAYPAAIQRLRVNPQELAREREFIERNLEATRAAYGLAEVEAQQFTVQNDLDGQQVRDNEVTIRNVRLWDPMVLETTYAELQALRTYYAFADVDVDRYEIDGELRQVMLSARELEQSSLPEQAQTWQNLTLTYTHGYGVVASQVNVADEEGQPVFLARDIPARGTDELVPERQGIYYGEEPSPVYSIVNTDQPELDYETSGGSEQVTTEYAGETGVPLGNYFRRLMFALRFADPNFLLSNLPDADSRVLYHRQITDRVRSVAPFLALDGDPYPVIADDRVLWVVDAYTTSAFYPYSERATLTAGGERRTVNYARNSVKAVVDAYDGTVELFIVDDEDPIVQAWAQAFPAPFRDLDDAPEGLEAHFRYPQDLFRLQSQLYRTYHIPGADAFYSKADAWDIPPDAARLANDPSLSAAQVPMEPYYLLMRLPEQDEEEFVLIQPYLARSRPNMNAWLAARSDPGQYGDLFAVQFPNDQTILGPQQAQARIQQNDLIAEYITLRDQAGSNVIRGNLLVIPIENSILYVQPLFLESPSARIPQLERVVLVMGDRVVMDRTLSAALTQLTGAEDLGAVEDEENRPGIGEDDEEEPRDPEVEAAELLREALDAFARADEALAAGDLGEYQRQIDRAQAAIVEAQELTGGEVPEDAEAGAAEGDDGGTDGGAASDDDQADVGGTTVGDTEPTEDAGGG